MTTLATTHDLHSLSSYKIGEKEECNTKSITLLEELKSISEYYKIYGMKHTVEAVLLVHYRKHPHILLLQTIGKKYLLPCTDLIKDENKYNGLKRGLNECLSSNNKNELINWEITELLCVWWRPEFDECWFPYLPPHVCKPKQRREIYLVPLPEKCSLYVPKNFKLLAVPLFELYDNPHRFGPVLAALPQQLGRLTFVYRDS